MNNKVLPLYFGVQGNCSCALICYR